MNRCAIYVGLFGNEYGFEDADGISPTEREFDRATECSKPRLIFVKGANDALRHPKTQALIRKAGRQLIRRRFNSIPESNAALNASLVDHLEQTGALLTGPFDASACPCATLTDLSNRKVAQFLPCAGAERGYALGPKTPLRDALRHLNLLVGDKPSHAAVLLFAKQPQRFLISHRPVTDPVADPVTDPVERPSRAVVARPGRRGAIVRRSSRGGRSETPPNLPRELPPSRPDARLIEYTIPDKPNSRLQKYRLTNKGRAWLAARKPPEQE